MTDMKHYFLSVDATELKHYSEKLHKLVGYVGTRISMKVDPEHGPVDTEGEILNECYPILKLISEYMSERLKSVNEKIMDETRAKMAGDIIKSIQNNESGIDLLLKLQQTLENYEIIGKRSFGKNEWDEEEFPF